MENPEGRLMLAFLVGAAIGVGVGMLVAPAPGKETRRKIKDFARRAQVKAQDLSGRFAAAAEDLATDASHPDH